MGLFRGGAAPTRDGYESAFPTTQQEHQAAAIGAACKSIKRGQSHMIVLDPRDKDERQCHHSGLSVGIAQEGIYTASTFERVDVSLTDACDVFAALEKLSRKLGGVLVVADAISVRVDAGEVVAVVLTCGLPYSRAANRAKAGFVSLRSWPFHHPPTPPLLLSLSITS